MTAEILEVGGENDCNSKVSDALGRSSESGSLPPSHTPAPFHSVLAP